MSREATRRLLDPRIVVLLVTVLFMLALGEIATRVFTVHQTPDTVRASALDYRPSIFSRHLLRANQDLEIDPAWVPPPSGEAVARYATSALGYRGSAFTQPKGSTLRVIVLGGSSVFDLQASEGHDWPSRLGRALEKRSGRSVEVLNAGVPGHASFDSLGRFYSDLWAHEPDLVVVYHGWNDLKYFDALTHDRPLAAFIAPHDPSRDPFRTYRNGLDRLLSSSQLYSKLRYRYLDWRLGPGLEGVAPNQAGGDRSLALRQFRLNVELLVAAVQSVGALPVLVTQASLAVQGNESLVADAIEYEYIGLRHSELVDAFSDIHDVLRQVASERDALLVDAAAALSGNEALFVDHVHTTPEGSRRLAAFIADALAEGQAAPDP